MGSWESWREEEEGKRGRDRVRKCYETEETNCRVGGCFYYHFGDCCGGGILLLNGGVTSGLRQMLLSTT